MQPGANRSRELYQKIMAYIRNVHCEFYFPFAKEHRNTTRLQKLVKKKGGYKVANAALFGKACDENSGL